MGALERKRQKFKGRGKGHTFLMLLDVVTDSPAWRGLSGNAVKLIVDLARQYRRTNNGDLSVPWSMLKQRGWKSQTTVNAAKHELLQARLIVCTRQGGKNRCSLYGVTWEPINDCGGKHEWPPERVPSHAWRGMDSGP